MQPDTPEPAPKLPPVRLWKTVRLGTRAAWDALGLTCAISLALFAAACVPLAVLVRAGEMPPGTAQAGLALAAAAAWVLVVPPLCAGACAVAWQVLSFEEATFAEMWRAAFRTYRRSVALGLVQTVVTAALAGNAAFYLTRGSVPVGIVGIVFVYALAFWLATATYHWPLLVAADAGVPSRADGRPPGVRSVLRNGLVMAVSSPGYTLGLAALALFVGLPLAGSGIGLALVLGGLAAFVTTRATRDQLVRFGAMPAPPDPDAPVQDEGWRV